MATSPESMGTRPPTIPVPEPPAVAELAAEQRLGAYHRGRTVVHPGRIVVWAPIVGVPSVALCVVGTNLDSPPVALLGFFGVLLALTIVAYAAKTAVAGGDDWYLYDGGVVTVRRRRPRAVRWAEVGAVERERMGKRARKRGFGGIGPDTLRGYRLRLRDGSSVFLFASEAFGAAKLLRADFEQQVTAAGLPIAG